MNEKTSKAAPEKKAVVKKVVELGKKYPIIGVINMQGLPADSLLKMKKQLRGKMELVMARKTLMTLGLEQLKLQNGEEVISKLKGVPALMFTSDNPFALYKTIKKSRTPAAAKAGQLAPYDIMLPKGPTPFGPGPIISEFAQLGIPAGVEGGKVAIKKDTVVVREGEPISSQLAGMLARLGIQPMEVGMDLHTVYEKGILYPKKVLDIDEKQFAQDLALAASSAFNLAVDVSYTTIDTIELLLGKASREAKEVALEGGVLAPDLVEDVIARAAQIAQTIKKDHNIQ